MVPEAVALGGYAFKEDFFAIDNGALEGPVVLPIHEAEMEDFIVGEGYKPAKLLPFSKPFPSVFSASVSQLVF